MRIFQKAVELFKSKSAADVRARYVIPYITNQWRLTIVANWNAGILCTHSTSNYKLTGNKFLSDLGMKSVATSEEIYVGFFQHCEGWLCCIAVLTGADTII